MTLSDDLLDKILEDAESSGDLLGKNGLLKQLAKRLTERMLDKEMTDHIGYEKHDQAGHNRGNSRNGHGKKNLITDHGKLEIKVPRDVDGDFKPQLIPKHKTRFPGFDEKIISLYA